jgi:hypothetical protein
LFAWAIRPADHAGDSLNDKGQKHNAVKGANIARGPGPTMEKKVFWTTHHLSTK